MQRRWTTSAISKTVSQIAQRAMAYSSAAVGGSRLDLELGGG